MKSVLKKLIGLALLALAAPAVAGTQVNITSNTATYNIPAIFNSSVTIKGKTPWSDIRAWGATTSTSTGNAAAIQNAIDSFVSSGTVLITGGVYETTAAVKLRENITLLCTDWGSGIKIASGTDIDLFVNYNYPSTGGADNAAIIGCTLDGNKAQNTNSGSGVMYGVTGFRLIGNHILGGDGTIPLLRSSDRSWITDNLIENSATDGVTIYDGSDNNVIARNIIRDSAGYGVLIQGQEVDGQTVSLGNQVVNNIITGHTFDGVTCLNGGNQTLISGNTISDNDNKGINIYSETTVSLTTAAANGDIVISNNVIKNNDSDEGIKVWDSGCTGCGAYNVQIHGNRISDDQGGPTQAYGITLQNQADYVWITDNNLRNNGTAGMLIGGGVNTNGAIWLNPGWDLALGATMGGTGQTAWTQGDIPYASAANTISKLAKNTSATRYLSNTGSANSPAWAQVDLSNGVTGTLPVGNLSTTGSGAVVLANAPTFTGATTTHEIATAGTTLSIYGANTDNTNGASSSKLHLLTGGGSGGDPFVNWQVSGATNWSMGIDNSDSDTLHITEGAGVGGVNTRFRMASGGNLQLSAYGAGTATFDASGNITSVSDERLKYMQGDFKRGLKDVLKIKPILYRWNEASGMETEHTYAGFSAQNVRKAIPEAVMENKQGFYSLQDRPVVGAMLNAIKELSAKVDALTARIAALEKKK